MSNFKIGDVVQLKSGGPTMTVSETNDAGMAVCTWFDSEHELKEHAFNQEILEAHKKVSRVGII